MNDKRFLIHVDLKIYLVCISIKTINCILSTNILVINLDYKAEMFITKVKHYVFTFYFSSLLCTAVNQYFYQHTSQRGNEYVFNCNFWSDSDFWTWDSRKPIRFYIYLNCVAQGYAFLWLLRYIYLSYTDMKKRTNEIIKRWKNNKKLKSHFSRNNRALEW